MGLANESNINPNEFTKTLPDISKIKTDFGWKPKVSIEEGIKILLENIDYWSKAPVWDPESIAEATQDWYRYLGKE